MFPLDSAFRIPPRLKFSILGCRAVECACKFQHQGGGARRMWSPRPTWATQPDLVPSTKNLVPSKGMSYIQPHHPGWDWEKSPQDFYNDYGFKPTSLASPGSPY